MQTVTATVLAAQGVVVKAAATLSYAVVTCWCWKAAVILQERRLRAVRACNSSSYVLLSCL